MEHLFNKVNQTSTCWLYNGYTEHGYGRIWVNVKNVQAHRHAYNLLKGDIPSGMVIRHLCNVKLCVNPDHLEIGTQQDNMDDMVKANRQAKGSKHGQAKLNEEQVKEIKELLLTGLSQQKIAERYKVSRECIKLIKSGKNWS